MIRLADRIANLVIGAFVGGPIRSVLLGTALLLAAGYWIGWWWVAVITVAALADFAWCISQLPARWRPW